MPRAEPRRSLSVWLLLVLVGVAFLALWDRPGALPSGPEEGAARAWAPPLSSVVLAAGEACRDVGYLCAALAGADSFRILRWPDHVARLSVHVPEPRLEDAGRARELQRAAMRGVERWDGRPLEVVVNDGSVPDIAVTWISRLDGDRLGRTQTDWQETADGVTFRVRTLVLATRAPTQDRVLAPDEVELVAVHEMGHALGLAHSDAEADVMFPRQTARFLTTRDHRTVEALYRMPNGALVRR